MAQVQLATKIDSKVKKILNAICLDRGLKINRFIEDAILDKFEELEDLEDIKALRKDSFRPLFDYLAELKVSGKL
jgi:hypothetical protein